MKKILTALVILTLALAMMTSGLAETVAEINWTDVDIASTGIEGSYYTFEDVATVSVENQQLMNALLSKRHHYIP